MLSCTNTVGHFRNVFNLVATILTFAAMLNCASTSCQADVIDYSFVKFLSYRQTVDNTSPANPVDAVIFSQLAADNQNLNSVQITGGASTINLVTNNGGFDWQSSLSFPTANDRDSDFPTSTSYTLNASGNSALDAFTTSLDFDENAPLPIVPFFTGSVVSESQGMDSQDSFAFEWNNPIDDQNPTVNFYFFSIMDGNGNEVFFEDIFGATPTSVVVPQQTLMPGTQYEAVITFTNLNASPDGAQPESFIGFAAETSMAFTTAVPEPASIPVLLGALLSLASFRRCR